MILNMDERKPLPVYGDGKNIRDWVHVEDHNDGVWKIIQAGKTGNTYNIGGGNEVSNIELTKKVLWELEAGEEYIEHVEDRKGHDLRYSLDSEILIV